MAGERLTRVISAGRRLPLSENALAMGSESKNVDGDYRMFRNERAEGQWRGVSLSAGRRGCRTIISKPSVVTA